MAERLESVIEAVSQPGASALLLGEPGAGKSRLAEAAAYTLEAQDNSDFFVIVMSTPPVETSGIAAVFGFYFPEILDRDGDVDSSESGSRSPQAFATRLSDAIHKRAAGREPILVVSDVHAYGPLPGFLLEHLVRSRTLRIIATAHRLTGAASRIGRDPRVQRIAIGPLSLEEADLFLSRRLGVAHIAAETLRRWHTVTAGNSYALGVLALSCERRGVLRRNRGLAWVPRGADDAPEEFAVFARETCSETELRTLELIAQAEPLVETALLQLVDPGCSSSLIEKGLVRTRRHPSGDVALETAHPILAAAIREHMERPRQVELCTQLFRALNNERSHSSLISTPQLLTRLVVFGLDSGQDLPHSWLSEAFTFLKDGADPRLLLRVSLELMASPDPVEAAVVAVRAASFARLLGDHHRLELAITGIRGITADPIRLGSLPVTLQTRLRLLLIEHDFWEGAGIDTLLLDLERLEAEMGPLEAVAMEMVRSSRLILLAYDGRLREAAVVGPDPMPSSNISVEWVRAPARAINALIQQQDGQLDDAIRIAGDARLVSLLGNRVSADTVNLQGFCWFFGFWASGSKEAGRQSLDELQESVNADIQAVMYLSGLVESGSALLAAQEARWRDAADQAQQLLEGLKRYDGYGLRPLVHAVHALALAALGERDLAVSELRRAHREQRGVSRAVEGFRRRLIVRTMQWLRVGDPAAEALEMASWARDQGVRLVELEALHMVALESRTLARSIETRAQKNAEEIDHPISDVIASHITKIVAGAHPSDVDEPEIRLLSEFGLWVPLPLSGGLSAREREVALFASLGYSSRFIAERLHLSARTVDTHLGHVYTKVGVEDRDGLRQWFANDRQFSHLNGENPEVAAITRDPPGASVA
ncbi:helix-turn-helix transcriptional regulator [Leucobacter sp. W1478]|uniref:helix-turn-helix transcriptional regulator n=1 Tax=Leucobacter sp. W1478 TaxID=3439065 RepID=UPI003F2AECF5